MTVHLVMDAVIALFGAVVGSFLNVCIVRLPTRESIVRPGSRCRDCERPLRWRSTARATSLSPSFADARKVTAQCCATVR